MTQDKGERPLCPQCGGTHGTVGESCNGPSLPSFPPTHWPAGDPNAPRRRRRAAPSAIARKRAKELFARLGHSNLSLVDFLAHAYEQGVKDVGHSLDRQQPSRMANTGRSKT